ncbi:MAG TPA: VOC family protein [Planococcus sp. (in: firmicutes)]|nr:VOC family protein [Planococcus sp. (in: firmicutes)]
MLVDHIVHFISKKPEEAATYWMNLGYGAAVGGQHVNWGTKNSLLYMKDCYIEWLALENPTVASNADHPLTDWLLYERSGFGTICFRTDDLNGLDQRLKGQGFETTGVLDAERLTASGEKIQWKMLFLIEEVSDHLPNPFFIQWQESDEKRFEKLRASGMLVPESEELEIEKCIIGVADVEANEEKWRKLLGGDLQLTNGKIEFRKTDRTKERLEEVHLRGGTANLEFEEAVYRLPDMSLRDE